MSIDKTIFGLRFGSSGELLPTQEDLKDFLKSPKMRGGREQRGHDTDRYSELLQNLRSFDQRWREKEDSPDLRKEMFYFVLDHSCFVNSALKSAVEQYQYHLHALTTLDFKKPTAFITAAEEEMSSLNPKKKEYAAKRARLGGMVEDRKRTLAALKKRSDALTVELSHIARYIRDNLVKIEKLCETAIVVLVNVQIGGREEDRMIAEIREHFKEHLRDYRQHGPIPREYLENVRNDLEGLTREISRFFREDVYALAGLYEAIHDHAQKTVGELDAFLARLKNRKGKDTEDDIALYAQAEDVLVSLVSNFRFELKTATAPADSVHQDLLLDKRKEMLERLFDLLQKERRERSDRRAAADRRRSGDSRFKELDRRKGKERRSGKSRRKT